MTQGRSARWAITRIERYRTSPAHNHGVTCRFEPTCSHFTEEALRTRPFLIALMMGAWRILRCNALASGGPDPVRRPRRLRLRRNGVATAAVAIAFTGLGLIVATEVAYAQSLNGGCTATINGQDPRGMTKSSPLLVHEHENVNLVGVVPPNIASLPPDQITSQTNINISIIEGVKDITHEQKPGTGPNWGGVVNVDDYLKYGVGLYHVEGESSGAPGWSCSGDGYIKLDGNPLSKPIGQAAAVVGAGAGVVALFSTRPKTVTRNELKDDLNRDIDNLTGHDPEPEPKRDTSTEVVSDFGCFLAALAFLFGAKFADRVFFGGPAAIVVPPTQSGDTRIWRRGHTVLGFISGLFLGLAMTVLAQQFAFWSFTVVTAIVFPILIGVLCAARARVGRPYKTAGPAAPFAAPAVEV